MNQQDFFQSLEEHFEDDLPFVVYRKPSEDKVSAHLQEDTILHPIKDFKESGFVFAPFNSEDSAFAKMVLIPSDCATIEIPNFEVDKSHPFAKRGNESELADATLLEKESHISLVKKGIQAIEEGTFRKVVLSRKQHFKTDILEPLEIFKRLLLTYPTAFIYCWYHPKVGLWLGATPETLLSISNRKLKTMSLAGTQKYLGTTEVSWGAKEREEQQLVTDSIVSNLENEVHNVEVSPVYTTKAGNLLHLKTDITAALDVGKVSLKSIINALHPTPAVCGLPKDDAKTFILNNENYGREYYTGYLGLLNARSERKRASHRRNVENLAYSAITKETSLYVNLRCMQITASGAQLYVGGGITASSDPEAEWEETVNKLETVGKVL